MPVQGIMTASFTLKFYKYLIAGIVYKIDDSPPPRKNECQFTQESDPKRRNSIHRHELILSCVRIFRTPADLTKTRT